MKKDTNPIRVLIVDDEKNIRNMLKVTLIDQGHDVQVAASAQEALKLFRPGAFDLVLTDFKMEKETGLDLLKKLRTEEPELPIIIMTAYSSIENAIEVTREGAFDYLPKPFTNAQLFHQIEKINKLIHLKKENESLRQQLSKRDYFKGFTSIAMARLEEFVRKVAPTDETVLLTGESGTGKSELAKTIYARSNRASKQFVTVSCTTIAESVLESELFGHVRGAYTGANEDKPGKLEVAHGGTLFLDEVGDLSLNAQAKLLRFLQDRVLERVGSNKEITVDVRIIAATNKNLRDAIQEGKFREDLYFRLNVLECEIVPLRHRKDDLPVLIQRFLEEISVVKNISRKVELPVSIQKALLSYSWPGNVRELRNVIERLVILAAGRPVEIGDLPASFTEKTSLPTKGVQLRTIEELEKEQIIETLKVEPNQEKAAQILGITPVTLWRKRRQFGLP